MSFSDLECLLRQTMGLDAASIGSAAVERAVLARMSACATENLASYARRVRTSAHEKQALIEAVVVPETWFFRDREAFEYLTRAMCEEWLSTHQQGTLRLLSMPCSSGEEPYSMSMALLDAGFPAERFQIDACDISARAVARAKRAQYGKNSFRGTDLGFRQRHFQAAGQGYRLNDNVRAQVRYYQVNLLAADFPQAMLRRYDVVFCRNLLIYFDRATQDRAVKVLRRLLDRRGMLFVGPTETALLRCHEFDAVNAALAFAFRLAERDAPAPIDIAVRRARPVAAPAGPDLQGIDVARGLADAGRLCEARRCCEDHLQRHGPSSQVYHLLGLIDAAAGKLQEADQHYRRALYLDPYQYETLLHLALLLQQTGAIAAALVLRERMARLEHKLGGGDDSQSR